VLKKSARVDDRCDDKGVNITAKLEAIAGGNGAEEVSQHICNNQEGVDEVELLSLVEEHIPKYKLRYDTITEFAGYDNNDWYIKTPVLDSEAPVDLSAETIGETLKYFILSGERLSQMTKTYNDIEVVTKLLEEKERDLELAARIGQSLLEQNKVLTNRSEELETELSSTNEAVEKLKFELFNTNERVIQLKHELSMKNGLLQVYCADIEAQELESEEQPHQSLEDKSIGLSNWDELNKRIGSLEEENLRLKCEATARANDIELEERKELQLIHDCAKQLSPLSVTYTTAEANLQILSFQEEVGLKGEDNVRQQEEITNLVTRVVELQRRARDLTFECDSLQNALQVSHECQNELSVELIEIKEKYGTLLAAFHELQTEFKKKSRFNTSHYQYMPFADSLASELESTLGSDCSDGELSSLGFRPVRKSAGNQNTGTEEMRCYSPDSVLSGDSFYYRYNNPQPMIGSTPYSNNTNNAKNYYMGDKLQIVKPLEGSTILRQWQKLATPHLGVILESLPLVTNKAIKDLDKELLEFTVNSMKECLKEGEKEVETKKHMNFVTTNSIYTYTTTSLSHITDSTSVTNSFSNVQLSTGVQSPIPTA
ncbi:unnamed protein product, partial [Oppiella nova]